MNYECLFNTNELYTRKYNVQYNLYIYVKYFIIILQQISYYNTIV